MLVFLLSFLLIQCSNSTEPAENPATQSDHTISQGGVMHKTGLRSPLTNCVNCHGSDLRGGTSEVSCYNCHGKKW